MYSQITETETTAKKLELRYLAKFIQSGWNGGRWEKRRNEGTH